jgi:hypothetical protein
LPLCSPSAIAASASKPPTLSTGRATAVSYSSATLTATVNPEATATSYYFQYGTTAYSAQTTSTAVGSGSAGVHVNQVISGLAIGVEYHYRVVAVSAAGTAVGLDRVFTTKKTPLRFEVSSSPRQVAFGDTLTISGMLTGTGSGGHEVVLQASPFPYFDVFSDFGAAQLTDAAGNFSFQVPALPQSTHLRVVTLDPVPVHSAVMTIRVAVRVALHVRRTRRQGYVRLYGTVTPAVSGAQVAFQWLRPGRAPAFAAGAVVKGGSANSARFSSVVFVPPGKGGYYRALVQVPDGRYVSASSLPVRLHASPSPRRRVRRRVRRRR